MPININAFGIPMDAVAIEPREEHVKAVGCGWCYDDRKLNKPQLPTIDSSVPMQSIEDMLIDKGGEIVSVDTLTAYEIARAKEEGRLATDGGRWFIWRPFEKKCR